MQCQQQCGLSRWADILNQVHQSLGRFGSRNFTCRRESNCVQVTVLRFELFHDELEGLGLPKEVTTWTALYRQVFGDSHDK